MLEYNLISEDHVRRMSKFVVQTQATFIMLAYGGSDASNKSQDQICRPYLEHKHPQSIKKVIILGTKC